MEDGDYVIYKRFESKFAHLTTPHSSFKDDTVIPKRNTVKNLMN